VRTADDVDDLDDVLRSLDADVQDVPACVTFVSGPSNTADIAAEFVTGVHGPGEILVWVVVDQG
jgi:L-lactate dehydrogenase complex protein LldG